MNKQDAVNILLDCIKKGTIAGEPLNPRAVEALSLGIGVIIQIDDLAAVPAESESVDCPLCGKNGDHSFFTNRKEVLTNCPKCGRVL